MMKALNRHVVREFNPDRKDSNQDPKRSWHWIEVLILSLAHVGLRRGQRGEGHSFHMSAMGHLDHRFHETGLMHGIHLASEAL